jgi:two-component system, NtrC family, nitrogen regulation response regulator NtrX
MASDVLVVDDEADIRELVAGILSDEGYSVRTAANSEEALAAVRARKPALLILDIWMAGGGLDGLELLDMVKALDADLPVIMISGHGNIETAVSAIKRGAYDYIEKPFKADRLVLVVGRALENSRLRRENEELRGRTGAESELIGNSPAMRQLRATLKKVAPTNSRVLIIGAMGSGKELTARVLHAWSHRSEAPFVILPAATMAPERIEAELFGTEDQSGGVQRTGALEEAHGGTLYIDEVADMPVETQGKVVRALVEQTFLRVGGSKKVRVDVRIVSSTSRDLEALIAQGRFREDLFHRLSVVPVRVPSLSERREDIVDLVEHFVKQYSLVSGQPRRTIAQDALAILQMHEWPGNVRQLRNNVERLLILVGGDAGTEITAAMMPADLDATIATQVNGAGAEHLMAMPLRDAREAFERDYLAAQLGRFGNNISKTAAFVGMERSALHRKLKLLGIGASARAEDAVET